MIEIRIEDEAASAALRAASRLFDDLSPVMHDVSQALADMTRERFVTGVGPDGRPWAPRSPATLASYALRYPFDPPGPKPLTLTGHLRRTLFAFSGPDHAGVGSPAIYSAVMQFGAGQGEFGATRRGSPIPWGDIPARPFLGLSAENREVLGGVIQEAIAAALARQSPA